MKIVGTGAKGFIVNDTKDTQSSDAASQDLRWYILKVAFNREDSVAEALRKRIALSGLQDSFDEILVPRKTWLSLLGREAQSSEAQALSGYIMVRMAVHDDLGF